MSRMKKELSAGEQALLGRYGPGMLSEMAWKNNKANPVRTILLAYKIEHINPRDLLKSKFITDLKLYSPEGAVKATLAAANEYIEAHRVWISAKATAAILHKSYGYVKDHGVALGGSKNERGQWQFDEALIKHLAEENSLK
jgi:hypothetical protein